MRLADKAAICGCVKRYTSRESAYMAESHAFSSNFDSAARWEHSRIPYFVMISLLFTTCISKRRISAPGTYKHCKMYME